MDDVKRITRGTGTMTIEALKAEVEQLWRPMAGPELPESGTDVLCRWKRHCNEPYTDYLVMTYDPDYGVWAETVELCPRDNDGEWRPIL